MDTQNEKRRITRADSTVKGQTEYNGVLYQGEIVNFSLNGISFKPEEPLDISEQEKIIVTIIWDDLNEDAASAVQCIVVRKEDDLLGLKFDVVDYDTLMLLKERLAAQIGEKVNEEFINFMIGRD